MPKSSEEKAELFTAMMDAARAANALGDLRMRNLIAFIVFLYWNDRTDLLDWLLLFAGELKKSSETDSWELFVEKIEKEQ